MHLRAPMNRTHIIPANEVSLALYQAITSAKNDLSSIGWLEKSSVKLYL